jgi:DNA-dependent RNA polymerase auxiliary subunit epsilon
MYYTVKVKMQYETDKGAVRSKTETYLVKAESVTDAEAIVHDKFKDYPQDFEVKSVSQSRIIDVYSAD